MKRIPLTKGMFAIVDDEDFDMLNSSKWCVTFFRGMPYAMRKEHRTRTVYMHRFIMKTPRGMEVDHINHDGLDNRRINLRNCLGSQNRHNMKPKRDSVVGFKGVDIVVRGKKKYFRARIVKKPNTMHIGYFSDAESAAKAYDKKAREVFGEFAYLNFPGR